MNISRDRQKENHVVTRQAKGENKNVTSSFEQTVSDPSVGISVQCNTLQQRIPKLTLACLATSSTPPTSTLQCRVTVLMAVAAGGDTELDVMVNLRPPHIAASEFLRVHDTAVRTVKLVQDIPLQARWNDDACTPQKTSLM